MGPSPQSAAVYGRETAVADRRSHCAWPPRLDRVDEAIAQCEAAIEVDPEFGNPYNDIGAYLLEKGEVNDAIPWLKKAKTARRYTNPEFACTNLGRVYEMQGRLAEAIGEYSSALRHNSEYPPARSALIKLMALLN